MKFHHRTVGPKVELNQCPLSGLKRTSWHELDSGREINLAESFQGALDIVTDQLDQLGFRKRLTECRYLHSRTIAVIRTRIGGELGVPFEVAQRASLFCFFQIRGLQGDLHELLAELGNEGEGNAAAIVVDAVTAK